MSGTGLVNRPPTDQLLTMMYWLRNETLRVVITYENYLYYMQNIYDVVSCLPMDQGVTSNSLLLFV